MQKAIYYIFIIALVTACAGTPKKPINTDDHNNELLTKAFSEAGWDGVESVFNNNSYLKDPNAWKSERVINLRSRTANLYSLKQIIQSDQNLFAKCQEEESHASLKNCVSRLNNLFLTSEQRKVIPQLEAKFELTKSEESILEQTKQQTPNPKETEKMAINNEFKSKGCMIIPNARIDLKEKNKQYILNIPCFGRDSSGACNLFNGLMVGSYTPAIFHSLSQNFHDQFQGQPLFAKQKGFSNVEMKDGRNIKSPIFYEAKDCGDLIKQLSRL